MSNKKHKRKAFFLDLRRLEGGPSFIIEAKFSPFSSETTKWNFLTEIKVHADFVFSTFIKKLTTLQGEV